MSEFKLLYRSVIMEIRVFIVSLACFCSLVPAVEPSPLLALKGAALLKAGLVAKGAALLAAKGAAVVGAKALLAKHLLGGGLLEAKKNLISASFSLIQRLTSHLLSKGAALLNAKHSAILSAIDAKKSFVQNLLPVQVVEKVEVLREEPITVEKPVYIPYPAPYPVPTVVEEPMIVNVMRYRTPAVYEILKSPALYPVPLIEKSVELSENCD